MPYCEISQIHPSIFSGSPLPRSDSALYLVFMFYIKSKNPLFGAKKWNLVATTFLNTTPGSVAGLASAGPFTDDTNHFKPAAIISLNDNNIAVFILY